MTLHAFLECDITKTINIWGVEHFTKRLFPNHTHTRTHARTHSHTHTNTHTHTHTHTDTDTRVTHTCCTYLVKLARFCVTLAMSVSVRAVRSSGYSCVRLKSDGDITAGHRNRRQSDALIKRSLMSGRPRLPHSCRHDAN